MNSNFALKPYTVKELSILYGIHKTTMLRWLEPFTEDIGRRVGRFYTIKQVKTIFDKLGTPDMDRNYSSQ